MRFLYSIGIHLFDFLLFVYGFFNARIGNWNKDRNNHFKDLGVIKVKASSRPIVWMHCASLGEFEQGLPLLNEIKRERPHFFILVTFFSPSGFHNRRKNEVVDDFIYIPLDTPSNARKWLTVLQPTIFIGVRYEFWWNFLQQLQKSGTPIVFISVVVKPDFYFLKKWLPFTDWLKSIDFLFTQDDLTTTLLMKAGCSNVYTVGDTRALSVMQRKHSVDINNDLYEVIPKDKQVIVYGSIYLSDLDVLHDMMYDSNFFHIVVPHHVDDHNVKAIECIFDNTFVRYSSMESGVACGGIIVDSIGHLFGLYHFADMVYIGGGFERSIHNTLEPAVFGLPIAIGPKHSLFIEAEYFLNLGIATEVRHADDFRDFVNKFAQKDARSIIRSLTNSYFESNSGSVQSIMNQLNLKIFR